MPRITRSIIKEYQRIKKENQKSVILYRLDNFYEIFFNDAIVVAQELRLALVYYAVEVDLHVPMCGIPCHSLEGYLGELLAKGFRISLCELLKPQSDHKGRTKRIVTQTYFSEIKSTKSTPQ